MAGYSILLPNYSIPWHNDNFDPIEVDNVLHLGLKVPGNQTCYIEVEDNIIYEADEHIFTFSDSKRHRAYNKHPTEERLILYVQYYALPLKNSNSKSKPKGTKTSSSSGSKSSSNANTRRNRKERAR